MNAKATDRQGLSGNVTGPTPDGDKTSCERSGASLGMPHGAAIGLVFGAGVGAALGNVGLGVGVGLALGVAVAMALSQRTKG